MVSSLLAEAAQIPYHFSRQHQPRQDGRVRACVRAQRRAFGKIQRQGAALPQEHREGQFRAGRDGLPTLKALPGEKGVPSAMEDRMRIP